MVIRAAVPAPRRSDSAESKVAREYQSIGDLASGTDVTVETLRYYERRGLLKPARRRGNGYREYAASAADLVRFIKRAQSLGFTLAEVGELVRLRERGWQESAGARLRSATVDKVREIDSRIGALRELREELSQLITRCDASCAAPAVSRERGADTDEQTDFNRDCALVSALESSDASLKGTRSVKSPKPERRFQTSTRKPARPNKEKRR